MAERESNDGIREALVGLQQSLDSRLQSIQQGIGFLHTAIADTRRDIGALDDKLVKIQEAVYFLAHKTVGDETSEEFRSLLPDPPRRRRSIEEWPIAKEG